MLQNTLKFIDEHHVPMSPETIFYDAAGTNIEFIYFPGTNKEFIGGKAEKDQVLYTLDLKELDKQIKEKSQELELNKVQLENAQNTLQSAID